jgi:uncharacterized membrane protein
MIALIVTLVDVVTTFDKAERTESVYITFLCVNLIVWWITIFVLLARGYRALNRRLNRRKK